MANGTAAAVGEAHGFIEEGTLHFPAWIAPLLGLLLILTGLAISYVPLPAPLPGKFQIVPATDSIQTNAEIRGTSQRGSAP